MGTTIFCHSMTTSSQLPLGYTRPIEDEIPPWTIIDTLGLLTLMIVPLATAPILYAGAIPLVPVAGKY
jgi:hypothetical protein